MQRAVLLILGALLAVGLFVVAIRTVSGEDSWICDKGEWVMHGKPYLPKPSYACPIPTPTIVVEPTK